MTARIVLTIAVFTLHEIDMFAELQLIKDPRIEDQVLARYDETLKSLRAEGFERLGVFETRHGPSLGPAALFIGNVGNEVWRYDRHGMSTGTIRCCNRPSGMRWFIPWAWASRCTHSLSTAAR